MNIVGSLEKLGLSEIEATIFVFLTQNGPARAPQIQAALGLNKVATYRALNTLNTSGVISTSGDKRLQKYSAEPLQKLLGRYDRNLGEIQRAREEFKKWSSAIVQKEEQLYKDRRIQVYEGIEGFRLWYDERLKGDVKVIREIGSNLYWQEFADSGKAGKHMANETMQKRLQKKIKLQSIYITGANSPLVPSYARTRQANLKETKVLDIAGLLTGDISIFGNRFGFYSEENGVKRGVVIEDLVLVGMMSALFENLWQQAKPV